MFWWFLLQMDFCVRQINYCFGKCKNNINFEASYWSFFCVCEKNYKKKNNYSIEVWQLIISGISLRLILHEIVMKLARKFIAKIRKFIKLKHKVDEFLGVCSKNRIITSSVLRKTRQKLRPIEKVLEIEQKRA